MKYTDDWATYPADGEAGKTVMVTFRENIEHFRETGKYIYRVEVKWKYDSKPDGMPADEDAKLMEEVTDALLTAFKKDTVAVMTGIYTGDGQRDWVFYTKNLHIFSNVFNKALENLPTIPIVIEAEEDKDWSHYDEIYLDSE